MLIFLTGGNKGRALWIRIFTYVSIYEPKVIVVIKQPPPLLPSPG